MTSGIDRGMKRLTSKGWRGILICENPFFFVSVLDVSLIALLIKHKIIAIFFMLCIVSYMFLTIFKLQVTQKLLWFGPFLGKNELSNGLLNKMTLSMTFNNIFKPSGLLTNILYNSLKPYYHRNLLI